MYYQYQQDRGPFNREKIWYPYNEDTPAYIIPPIANISDGPSGLEYYPGTGFGEDFRGRFFLCDFRGDAARSGIRSWRNKAKGAYWEVVEDEKPFWNMLLGHCYGKKMRRSLERPVELFPIVITPTVPRSQAF